MRLKEIETRLAEIRGLIDAADAEALAKLTEETNTLTEERKGILEQNEKREALKLRVLSGEAGKPYVPQGVTVPQNRFTAASPEYRDAWAKTLLCQPLTETEQRAMRDVNGAEYREAAGGPLTTTDTIFAAGTVNNGGLFIPESVSLKFLEDIVLGSPILEDTFKMAAPGLTKYPYEKSASDAEWKTEGDCNDLEQIEWAELTMTAKELSKTIRVTWKLEAMTPTAFVDYLMREMRAKMQQALAMAIIYGTGVNDLTGYKLSDIQYAPAAGTPIFDALVNAGFQVPSKAKRIGQKLYISDKLANDVALAKDSNGDYVIPPVNGAGISQIGRFAVAVDPYLNDQDFIVANLRRDAILNTHETLSITKDVMGRCRINDYTAFAIYSNIYLPGTVVFGTMPAAATP